MQVVMPHAVDPVRREDYQLVRRRIAAAFGLITLYDVLVSLAAGDRGYLLDAAANGTAMAR